MEDWNVLIGVRDLMSYRLFIVNQTPVTISSLVVFFSIIGFVLVISHVVKQTILNALLRQLKLAAGTQYTLSRLLQYSMWLVGGIVAFQFIGIDLSGLAVIFGFLSVGIGFGLQNITSNFISGLILLFEQHIQVGDRVTVGQTEGDVVEINIRSTTIRSLNNIAIIVPNSEFISGTVVNWSHGDPKTRLEIDVGVSYNSELDTVVSSLLEVAQGHPSVLSDPKPDVLLVGFGDSAWNMRLLVWVDNPTIRLRVTSEINCAIVRKFREKNVEIPFPQRDLHVRSTSQPIPFVTAS